MERGDKKHCSQRRIKSATFSTSTTCLPQLPVSKNCSKHAETFRQSRDQDVSRFSQKRCERLAVTTTREDQERILCKLDVDVDGSSIVPWFR